VVADRVNKLGIESFQNDSTLLLFTSVNQCAPCQMEIEVWNGIVKSEKSAIEVILIVNERFERNFEAYIGKSDFEFQSVQDSVNIFRNEDIIPYLPYKILLTRGEVIHLGELGNMKLVPSMQ
jgi:hypothetical protein